MPALVFLLAKMLTPEIAARLAELHLHCIQREYPNKTGNSFKSDSAACLSPRQVHSDFYGCPGHSRVPSQFMLVCPLKTTKPPLVPARLPVSSRPIDQ